MQEIPVFFRSLAEILKKHKQDLLIAILMSLVTILITTPIYTHVIYASHSDFPDHILFSRLILEGNFLQVPIHILAHPGYQTLLIGLYVIGGYKVGMFAIADLIQVVVQVLIVGVIYLWLGPAKNKGHSWIKGIFAITLTLVAPVMVFAIRDKLFYLGYIGLANYHNPTVHLLKLIALISFMVAARVFSSSPSSVGKVILSAILIILSALIKPNYLICILPALTLLAGINYIYKKPIDWRLLIFGFIFPGILILGIQFVITYVIPNPDESSILFSPFTVMRDYSQILFPKLILSILFPLSLLVFNFRQVTRDITLLISWLGFLISLFMTYFLAEAGVRQIHGNFLWGSQIMLFLLFVASARFLWINKFPSGFSIKEANFLTMIAYFLQVGAGFVYYLYTITLYSGYPF